MAKGLLLNHKEKRANPLSSHRCQKTILATESKITVAHVTPARYNPISDLRGSSDLCPTLIKRMANSPITKRAE